MSGTLKENPVDERKRSEKNSNICFITLIRLLFICPATNLAIHTATGITPISLAVVVVSARRVMRLPC
ncbi:hypothetical protein [Akkermansia muciniphila]|uniref:hypothetical protein n=1 Tax=Akkermansia muciniphila TaxID=239935 RepID=UPI001C37C293|nr:hypothetical protein [Akkermansia muciniphila]